MYLNPFLLSTIQIIPPFFSPFHSPCLTGTWTGLECFSLIDSFARALGIRGANAFESAEKIQEYSLAISERTRQFLEFLSDPDVLGYIRFELARLGTETDSEINHVLDLARITRDWPFYRLLYLTEEPDLYRNLQNLLRVSTRRPLVEHLSKGCKRVAQQFGHIYMTAARITVAKVCQALSLEKALEIFEDQVDRIDEEPNLIPLIVEDKLNSIFMAPEIFEEHVYLSNMVRNVPVFIAPTKAHCVYYSQVDECRKILKDLPSLPGRSTLPSNDESRVVLAIELVTKLQAVLSGRYRARMMADLLYVFRRTGSKRSKRFLLWLQSMSAKDATLNAEVERFKDELLLLSPILHSTNRKYFWQALVQEGAVNMSTEAFYSAFLTEVSTTLFDLKGARFRTLINSICHQFEVPETLSMDDSKEKAWLFVACKQKVIMPIMSSSILIGSITLAELANIHDDQIVLASLMDLFARHFRLNIPQAHSDLAATVHSSPETRSRQIEGYQVTCPHCSQPIGWH